MLPYALIAMAMLMVGLLMARLGSRGRAGDHPHCRHCDRDLFGLESPRHCPECGHDASRPVRGERRPSRPLAIAGGVSALLGAVGLATIGWATASGENLNRYKLTSTLRSEASTSPPALRELVVRERAAKVGQAEVADLARRFIADQADLSLEWNQAKANWIEQAARAGLLTDAEQLRYLEQAWTAEPAPALVVPKAIREGMPLPMRVAGGWRGGSAGGNLAVELPDGSRIVLTEWLHARPLLADLAGKVRAGDTVDIRLVPAIGFSVWNSPNPITRPIASVDVVAADAHLVEVVDDPALADVVRRSLTLGKTSSHDRTPSRQWKWIAEPHVTLSRYAAALQAGVTGSSDPLHDHRVSIRLALHSPAFDRPLPLALSWSATLREGNGREWPVTLEIPLALFLAEGSMTRQESQYQEFNVTGVLPAAFDAERVDLVLRPAPLTAELTADNRRILGGEIVFEDVPVRLATCRDARTSVDWRPSPAARPVVSPGS